MTRTTQTDTTARFFDELGRRGHAPVLGGITGSVRFDIADGDRVDHWLLTIAKGDLSVTSSDGPADAVIRADRAQFDDVAAGRVNPMAAMLRGAVSMDGDPMLLVRAQRLFPAPTAPPATAADRSVGRRRS
jgi:putative sterol carrier protein